MVRWRAIDNWNTEEHWYVAIPSLGVGYDEDEWCGEDRLTSCDTEELWVWWTGCNGFATLRSLVKNNFPSDFVGVSLIPFLPYSGVVVVYLLHLVDASQPSSQRRTCHDFCLMPNLLIHSLSVIWRKMVFDWWYQLPRG